MHPHLDEGEVSGPLRGAACTHTHPHEGEVVQPEALLVFDELAAADLAGAAGIKLAEEGEQVQDLLRLIHTNMGRCGV